MWNIWQPLTMCKHGKTAEQQWTMVLNGAQPVLVTVSSDSPDAAMLFQPVGIHFWHQTNSLIKHQPGFSWWMVHAFIQYVWYWGRLGAGGSRSGQREFPPKGGNLLPGTIICLLFYPPLPPVFSRRPSTFTCQSKSFFRRGVRENIWSSAQVKE